MNATATKYPVLDVSGMVKEWLEAGRGLRVWECQEIGNPRGDMLTPGDVTTEPHWAYKGGDRLLSADDVVFFRKGRVAYFPGVRTEWKDTPAGWKAALRNRAKLPKDNGDAPLKLSFEYTVETLTYTSAETSDGGVPVGLHYFVAIVQWSAPRE